MPSSFRQLFQKSGGDSLKESAGSEDLEYGHPSLVPQNTTLSGLQLSPRGRHPPAILNVLASTGPPALRPSCKYVHQAHFNAQHGLTGQLPLTPSGSSRVIGYLPRATCDHPSSFVAPDAVVMPSQHSQHASDGDWMSSSGPECRFSSVASIKYHRSQSPKSPFDPYKHGLALQRLETHGSFKTAPSSQQEGVALNRLSLSWLETRQKVSEEHQAAVDRDSPAGKLESRTSADTDEIYNHQTGSDLSLPSRQLLPTTVHEPVVLDRGSIANASNAPNIEGGQFFKETLPSLAYPSLNSEANNSSQVTQQQLHSSHILAKPRQVLPSTPNHVETLAVDASSGFRSKNPSPEVVFQNDAMGRLTREFGAGTQDSEQYGNLPNAHKEEQKEQQGLFEKSAPGYAHQPSTIVESPALEGMNEFLWSPAPSDDSQEAPSIPHTAVPRHTRPDAFLAFPTSGLASDSHDGLSGSISYNNEVIESWSGWSANPSIFDSPLPQIDVLIPAGNINIDPHTNFLSLSQQASTTGGRESSSILFRYSGIVTDGASSRPMSEIELKEQVKSALEDQEQLALSMPSSMKSISQADHSSSSEQFRGGHEPNARSETFALDRLRNRSTDAGPGSSQTSSSMSTIRCDDNLSGYKVRSGIQMLPISRARCHTPPSLFGRSATTVPTTSNAMSNLADGNAFGSFDQNLEAARPNKTGLLPTTLYSLDEQDWETVSFRNEAHPHPFDSIASNMKTGSSLADNSDSGDISLSKEMHHPFRSMKIRPVMQHPAHPRHNYSFMLLKNSQTGDLVQVPQYEHASGGCLPNNNASSQLVLSLRSENSYQHPSPIPAEHTHPFTSPPPIVRFTSPSAINSVNNHVWVQQNHLDVDSSDWGLSKGVQRVKGEQTQDPLYETTHDVLRVPRPALQHNQHQLDSREQSHQSSAWFSTVSKVTSSESSLPGREDPLMKMRVRNRGEHVAGTSEQNFDQHVGSSVADASSPGASFSSNLAPLVSSLIQISNTSLSLRQMRHEQAIQRDLDFSSQHILADLHKSLARSSNHESSAMSFSNTKSRSRSHSACGIRSELHTSSPRRHRSSSESSSKLMDSPSALEALATNLLLSDGDPQQSTSSRPPLRNPFLHMDNPRYQNLIERRDRRPKMDDASIDDTNTPSTTESRPFVRRGFVQTDAPAPILDHSISSHDRQWNHVTSGPMCPRPHPKPPLGSYPSQRPIARAESPHLHRIPHRPTTELLERHVLLSRVYLIPFMVIPPIALVYGHGYMDSLMRLHTAGEINSFRTTEKIIALCWGYGLSAICIFIVIIAVVIIPTSA